MSETKRPGSDALAAGRGAAHAPLTVAETKLLFSDFRSAPVLVLAVSGGPDSVALMVLAARWRAAYRHGPRLVAVTVDHGLRRESAAEARAVKALARTLDIEHHTLRWRGAKPQTGVPSAARQVRYGLLARLARETGAVHVLTGHTRDDQAETVLMRLSRGSGLAGLAAMARQVPRDGWVLARPLLDVPKSRLVATVRKAGLAAADDPTNRNPEFTRPRLRALMPALAREGCDARNLARLARRLARANAALDTVTAAAERALLSFDRATLRSEFEGSLFFAAPEEIRLRLLLRAIDRAGHEGPAELGKAESLLRALEATWQVASDGARLKQTLAGAAVALSRMRVTVTPAPPRRT
ncbi:MAG: tRNA lysidine(34) synthetase TilS [Xanthobacteraceae bacterium]